MTGEAPSDQGGAAGARLHGIVGPRGYDSSVGRVIDLEAWREERERDPVRRLERAIGRIDQLLARGTGRIGARVESELLAITGAVTAGLDDEAAERAERLADRLEHPASRVAP